MDVRSGDLRSADQAVAAAAEVVVGAVRRSMRSRCVWAVREQRKSRCGGRHHQHGGDTVARTPRYPG